MLLLIVVILTAYHLLKELETLIIKLKLNEVTVTSSYVTIRLKPDKSKPVVKMKARQIKTSCCR